MGKACYHCTRILVVILNFLFVLIGCCIVGISIFLYVDQTVKGIKEEMQEKVMVDIVLFTAIGIGGITIVVSTFGCCGAYHESECLLGTYFFCLFVIVAAEIAAVVVGYMKLDKKYIEENIDKAIKTSIENYKKTKGDLPPHLFNMQKLLKCCGASGPLDYGIPTGTKKFEVCSMKRSDDSISGQASSIINSVTNFRLPGCTSKIMSLWENNGMWVLGVALGIVIFELLAMIVAISLCCSMCRAEDGYVGVAT